MANLSNWTVTGACRPPTGVRPSNIGMTLRVHHQPSPRRARATTKNATEGTVSASRIRERAAGAARGSLAWEPAAGAVPLAARAAVRLGSAVGGPVAATSEAY